MKSEIQIFNTMSNQSDPSHKLEYDDYVKVIVFFFFFNFVQFLGLRELISGEPSKNFKNSVDKPEFGRIKFFWRIGILFLNKVIIFFFFLSDTHQGFFMKDTIDKIKMHW